MGSDYVTLRAQVDRATYEKLRRYARATARPMSDVAGALLEAAASDHDLADGEPANVGGTEASG